VTKTIFGWWELVVADDDYIRNGRGNNTYQYIYINAMLASYFTIMYFN
jgi:hypothetical protein